MAAAAFWRQDDTDADYVFTFGGKLTDDGMTTSIDRRDNLPRQNASLEYVTSFFQVQREARHMGQGV